MPRHHRRQFVRWTVDSHIGVAESLARGLERAPDAVSKLTGGGNGEGDDQQLVDAPALLNDQAGDQSGQGIGLPGAGAGLDQQVVVESVR